MPVSEIVGPRYVMEMTDGLGYMDVLQQFVITRMDGNLNTIFLVAGCCSF